MSAITPQINATDSTHLISNLNVYFKGLSWKEAWEVPVTGRLLHSVFEPLQKNALAIEAGEQRISNLDIPAFKLSSIATKSLKETCETIFEFYKNPESWVLPECSNEFRSLILKKIDQQVTELIKSTKERCEELIQERVEHDKHCARWQQYQQKTKRAIFCNDEILLDEKDQDLRYHIGCEFIESQEILNLQGANLCSIRDVFDSKKVAMELLASEAWYLRYFSKRLRADRELVFLAYQKSFYVLKWAEPSLMKCPHFVSQCLIAEGRGIEYVDRAFDQDSFLYSLALECQSNSHLLLKRCSKALRSDGEKILEIVKYNAEALFAATDKLIGNREFLLRACHVNGSVLTSLEDRYWSDDEFLLAALKSPFKWFNSSASTFKWSAIHSFFSDIQCSEKVCLGLLKTMSAHLGDERWSRKFGDRHVCLAKFKTYLRFSNKLLVRDLNFWIQAISIEPCLIVVALNENKRWANNFAILEELKNSHRSVKLCVDQFTSSNSTTDINPAQLVQHIDSFFAEPLFPLKVL